MKTRIPAFFFITLLAFAAFACNLTGATGESVPDEKAPALLSTPPSQQPSPEPAPDTEATPTRLSDEFLRPLDIEEQLITNLYERVGPAVVHVTSRVVNMDFFFGAVPSEGTGSGFIVDKEGYVVTNFHVVEGARSIAVTLADETEVPAEVVGVDPPNDLALLHIDVPPEQLIPVELGSSDNLRVGQRAIAIGNPFGLDRTLTVGVISALGRPLQTSEDNLIFNVVQTDAAINPGNSGGPLLDSSGHVVGVNTAIRQGAEGIGFAVPVDTVKRVLPALKERGTYPHPWLGFLGYDLTPDLAGELNLPVESGILVAQLYRNGPAAAAGLQGATREQIVGNRRMLAGGDIVVGIDDAPVEAWEDLSEYLELETEVGDTVVLHILRDGEAQELAITVAEQP